MEPEAVYSEPDEEFVDPVGKDDLSRLIDAVIAYERASRRLCGAVDEIGEQTAARLLGAKLRLCTTGRGWDARSPALKNIQIRTRMPDLLGRPPSKLKLDGEFDTLVFVYLGLDYRPIIVHQLSHAEAKLIRDRYAPTARNVPIGAVLERGRRLLGEGVSWPPAR